MSGKGRTPVELGIFPDASEELIRLELEGRLPGRGTRVWSAKREAALEALRWLYQRGFDLCEGDIGRSREDVVAGELWGTAEYLLHILEERLPEEEEEYTAFLVRAGLRERSAAQLAAESRFHVEYAVVLALELGLLATAAGLRDHMADLLRGEKVREAARRGHEVMHGTSVEKQERWGWYQEVVNRIRAENPDASWSSICRWAAKRCGVSAKTIQRRCTDPKKK